MRRSAGNAVASLLFLAACGSDEPGEIIRTPYERFENLYGFDCKPHHIEIAGLRIHYVDEGPRSAMSSPPRTGPNWPDPRPLG